MDAEQQDFAKFVRFFTTRLVQTLVQARLGRTIETQCNLQADARDWFNVNIEELGEVSAYIKTAVSKRVSVQNDDVDDSVNIRTQFYHQLGTLLKSAAAAARVTPAHRYYVRKQSADSFVVMYQVSLLFLFPTLKVRDTDEELDMGDDAKQLRLGRLTSPYGTLFLDLTYRTNMAVAPKRGSESSLLSEESSEAATCVRPKSLPLGASTACNIPPTPSSRNINEFSTSPPDMAFPFIRSPTAPPASDPVPVSRFRLGHSTSSEESSSQPEPSSLQENSFRRKHLSGSSLDPRSSFSRTRGRNNSFPFAVLLSSSREPILQPKRNSTCATGICHDLSEEMEGAERKDDEPKSEAVGKEKDKESEGSDSDCEEGGLEMHSSDDSYVKVFAFAHGAALPTDPSGNSELGEFIKECRQAPNSLPATAHIDTADAIREQLVHFKSQESNFDDFVKMINEKVAENTD